MSDALPPLDDELDAMLAPGRTVPPISATRRAALLTTTLEKVATEGSGPGGTIPGRFSFGVGGLVIGMLVGGGAMWAWNRTPHDVENYVEPRVEPSAVSTIETGVEAARYEPPVAHAPSSMMDPPDRSPRGATPAVTRPADTPRARRTHGETGNSPENETPQPVEPPGADSLSAERRIIDAALAQVSSGHAAAALRAVARHETLFAAGQLAEAREVVRVRALAQLGRMDEARASLAALEDTFPNNRAASSLRTLLSQPVPSRERGPR
jgi:hypothetical protein